MSKYSIDGVIVDTDKAKKSWEEDTRWNGRNRVSVATGSQWEHQELHLSAKGNYYIESWSQWQGSTPSCEFVSAEQAAHWLLANNHDLPADLAHFEEALAE